MRRRTTRRREQRNDTIAWQMQHIHNNKEGANDNDDDRRRVTYIKSMFPQQRLNAQVEIRTRVTKKRPIFYLCTYHPAWCPNKGFGLFLLCTIIHQPATYTKIGDPYITVLVYQYVSSLDISVNLSVVFMNVLQP